MTAVDQVEDLPRFAFGENWRRFLRTVDDARIREAERSLQTMLDRQALAGSRFLDIGCGSGLFSLAARRLGADVVSFDFDPLSVACAKELRERYCPGDSHWRIEHGSILDADFMRAVGRFDIVYSWGVLHHTGAMWEAVARAGEAVRDTGLLFIALYNDQGSKSVWWRHVKRTCNRLPAAVRPAYVLVFAALLEVGAAATAIVRRQPGRLRDRWTRYHSVRGMSRWHDLVDWIGGYPFEVAAPAAVTNFCAARGFSLVRLHDVGRKMGCNEFVFARSQ